MDEEDEQNDDEEEVISEVDEDADLEMELEN